MRVIKFRAMATPDEAGKIDKIWYSTDDVGMAGFWELVDTKTFINVCQYTGITDKHGKEIYEGDIIVFSGKHLVNFVNIGKVTYDAPGFVFSTTDGDWSLVNNAWREDGEVIGNIYENPELLISQPAGNITEDVSV